MKNNNLPRIDPFGFREYDARWIYPQNINLPGIENLGIGLGTQISDKNHFSFSELDKPIFLDPSFLYEPIWHHLILKISHTLIYSFRLGPLTKLDLR